MSKRKEEHLSHRERERRAALENGKKKSIPYAMGLAVVICMTLPSLIGLLYWSGWFETYLGVIGDKNDSWSQFSFALDIFCGCMLFFCPLIGNLLWKSIRDLLED